MTPPPKKKQTKNLLTTKPKKCPRVLNVFKDYASVISFLLRKKILGGSIRPSPVQLCKFKSEKCKVLCLRAKGCNNCSVAMCPMTCFFCEDLYKT